MAYYWQRPSGQTSTVPRTQVGSVTNTASPPAVKSWPSQIALNNQVWPLFMEELPDCSQTNSAVCPGHQAGGIFFTPRND